MKKGALMIISLLFIILSGCSGITNPKQAATSKEAATASVQVDVKKLQNSNFQMGSSDIVEDVDYIYYSTKDGIYKLNKKDNTEEWILKMEKTGKILLEGDFLYFVVSYDKEDVICRIDKKGDGFTRLVSSKSQSLTDEGAKIQAFFIEGNNILFKCAVTLFSYDMTSNIVSFVQWDADCFRLRNGYAYYTDYNKKTYTIYRQMLNQVDSYIILGEGSQKPKNVYYKFAFYGDEMFYSAYKSDGKYGIYSYKNGVSTNINDNFDDRVLDILEYMGSIYYCSFIDRTDCVLMEYDLATKKESKVGVLKDYKSDYGFTIVNGYVYYSTKDGSAATIPVK